MRRASPNVRSTKPKMPCMQPIAVRKNKMTNSTSRMVRDADQPVRQSRSANSIETTPVSSSADE